MGNPLDVSYQYAGTMACTKFAVLVSTVFAVFTVFAAVYFFFLFSRL
jgi:hypothetical protein